MTRPQWSPFNRQIKSDTFGIPYEFKDEFPDSREADIRNVYRGRSINIGKYGIYVNSNNIPRIKKTNDRHLHSKNVA